MSSEESDATSTDSAPVGTGHRTGTHLKQDPSFWTPFQLQVLHLFKEEWFLASGEDKKHVLQKALKELSSVNPKVNEDKLKHKVVHWFKRRVKLRVKWGPGRRISSLCTILYWYKGDHFSKLVKERYPQQPGETRSTKPNIGAMSAMVAEYMHQLETDPSMAEEKEKFEKLRLDWARNGAPKDKHQKLVPTAIFSGTNVDFGVIGQPLRRHPA